jgi:hypothetical protein
MSDITPKQAARFTQVGNESIKAKEFLLTASPRQIQEFIHNINTADYNPWIHRARTALDIRLAEDAAHNAQILSQHTEKLVYHSENLTQQTQRLVSETLILRHFTKGVFWLTVVLAVFTFVQIVIACFEYSTKAHDGIKSGPAKQQTSPLAPVSTLNTNP